MVSLRKRIIESEMPVLEKIVVSDFRNIELQELDFSPNIHCISGNNGEGKTNLLDAIYYLSMTKSAFAASDKFNFRYGTDSFSISGNYRMDNGLKSRFSLQITSKGEKKVRRDDKVYGKVSEHIGQLPIVLVSPSDTTLVSESGEERRRFANAVLSQMDREYLVSLQQYNRLLLQRTRLLKEPGIDRDLLEVIDLKMAGYAAPVHAARKKFAELMAPVAAAYYAALSGGAEEVDIRYGSQLDEASLEALRRSSSEASSSCEPYRMSTSSAPPESAA